MLYDRPNWAELYFDKKKNVERVFLLLQFHEAEETKRQRGQWHTVTLPAISEAPPLCICGGTTCSTQASMSEKNEWKVKNCEKQTACKERKYLFKVIRRKICVPLPLFKLINLFICFSFVLLNFLLLCIFAKVPSKFPSVSATVI